MKKLNVVAAIIKKDNKILATQRGYGEFEGLWEFPGGKIEEGETKEEALIREIKEELNADIIVEILAIFYQKVESKLSKVAFAWNPSAVAFNNVPISGFDTECAFVGQSLVVDYGEFSCRRTEEDAYDIMNIVCVTY